MPRYSVDLSINTKGYTEGLDQAKQANAQFDSSVNNTDKDVIVLTKELRKTKKEAQNLAAQYMLLSKAEKESELGQDLKAQLDIAIEKAAEFQDVLTDVNEAIRNAASDTAGWDALKETMEISKSATLAVAGAFAKVTGNAEGLQNMIKTITVVENGFNAVIKIGNALQAQSKTMLALRRAGIISTTQAQKLQTITTTAATGATKALGLAMKALPLVAIVGSIMAVGSALMSFTKKTDDATKASISQKKELTSLQKALNDISNTYTTSYTNALGSTLSKYEQLKRQYLALSSRREQIEWFKDHKKECQNLEVGINTLIDADKAFTNESEKVIKVLRIRALMTAEAARNAELYAQMMKEIDTAQKNVVKFKEGDKLGYDDIKRYGLKEGKDYKVGRGIGDYTYTDEGARKASDEAAKKNIQTHTSVVEDALKQSNARLDELATELQQELGSLTTGGSKSGASKEQLTYLQELVKAAEEAKKNLENIGKTGTQEQIDAALTDYQNKLKAIEDYKIKIGLAKPDDEVTAYIKKLKENLKEQENKFQLGVKLNDKKMQEEALNAGKIIQDELDTYTFNIKVKPKVEKSEVDKIYNDLNGPKQPKYDFNFLPDKYKNQADDVLDRLNELTNARKKWNEVIEKGEDADEMGKAVKYLQDTQKEYDNLTDACNRFNQASEKIKERSESIEKFKGVVSDLNNVVSSIDGVVGAFERLDKAFSENSSGWEKFMAVWNVLMSVMQAVITVMTVINTIQDMMNAKNAVAEGIATGSAAAHSATAAAQTAEAATTTALAAAQTAATPAVTALYKATKLLAAAQIFAAHAAIPFAGPSIAAGFVSMMEGVLAGLMAFARGGIVDGSSFYGDHILARVNSGEMILTKQQQKNLFDAIDNNKLAGAGSNNVVVTGKIRGKDLLLVQKNYNTIGAKSGQSIKIG